MKKILSLIFFSTIASQCFAEQYFSVLYQGEKPDVLRVAWSKKSICEDTGKRLIKSFGEKNYKYECSSVIMKDKNTSSFLVVSKVNSEEPIVLPVTFKSKEQCEDKTKQVNDVTKETVNIDRLYDCYKVANN
jgi:hypothetical protein